MKNQGFNNSKLNKELFLNETFSDKVIKFEISMKKDM